jgi:3-methyladenine DNA glycosylase Mpg
MDEQTKSFFGRDVKQVAEELVCCKLEYKGLEATITSALPFEGISKSAHKKENFNQEPGYVWTNNRRGHTMLNINAYDTNPSCILINGVKINDVRIKGPGNVTHALGIDDKLTGTYVGDKIRIYKPN